MGFLESSGGHFHFMLNESIVFGGG